MYIALLLGIISLFFGIRNNHKRKQLLKIGVRTPGVITRYNENEMNGRTIYYPVVRLDAEDREIVLPNGSSVRVDTGSKIDILYDPADPDEVIEYSDSISTVSLIFIIVGSLFTLLGLVGLVYVFILTNL